MSSAWWPDGSTAARCNFRFNRSGPITEGELRMDRRQMGEDYQLLANPRNEYLLDRDKQRRFNFTGIDGLATQDACVTTSMGAISDRSKELLGTSDTYVIALRRFLLKAVKDFQKGAPPTGLPLDGEVVDYGVTRCTWTTVPAGRPWREVEAEIYTSL